MRFISICTAVLVSAIVFATTANAEPSEGRGRHRMPPKLREKLLEKFDANGDGKLDETERAAAREAVKAKREAHKQKIFEKFDANGDGKLDEQERAAAKEAFKAKSKERFDENGDGELDETERAAAKRFVKRIREMRRRGRTRRHRRGGGEGLPPTTPD